MRIVLDTNVFVADFWMKGADFQTLLSVCQKTGHRLFVPQIVVDEVTQKFAEGVNKLRADGEKLQASVGRLVPNAKLPLLRAQFDGADVEFIRHFKGELKSAGAEIIAYPKTSHASFARRAVEKKHPFDERGAGYRDALVWDAVLSLARQRGDEVAFVTQDIGDFLRKTGNDVELHPELAAELSRATGNPRRVRAFHTLGRFVGAEVQPRLEEMVGLPAAIRRSGRVGKIDVRAALLAHLRETFQHMYIDPTWLGFPMGTEHVQISEVTGVPQVEVDEVRRLSDGRLVLSLTAAVEVRFFAAFPQLPPVETASVEEFVDTSAVPVELDDSEEGAFKFSLRAIINKSRTKISSVQIRYFDPAS